ncbi:gamma-glutamylcyclotransferase [Paenibacillus sp. CC-CFT747]|nr:gamma-glutamylcyclotransferase [Paenibacillus sp. CC-CFT747]
MPEVRKEWLSYNSEFIPDGIWPVEGEPASCIYFAYGSCMSRASLADTVPAFDLIGSAIVQDMRVGFTRYSKKWGGGVADLVNAPDHHTEGVLYRIPTRWLSLLDIREGAYLEPPIYSRVPIAVFCDGIPIPAFTYEVVRKHEVEIAPHPQYMETILSGTDLLSTDYVQGLIKHMQSLG